MSDVPIITQIKNALDILISSQSCIKQVQVCPFEPIDRDTAQFPFVAIYDEPESWESRNRLEMNVTLMTFGTWVKASKGKESVDVKLDLIEATLHKAILADWKSGALHKLVQLIEKQPPTKDFTDDDLGVLIQRYLFTYNIKWGNPFTNKY